MGLCRFCPRACIPRLSRRNRCDAIAEPVRRRHPGCFGANGDFGAACPDHLVHTKRVPLWIPFEPATDSIETLLGQTSIEDHALRAAFPWLNDVAPRVLAQIRNDACYAGYLARQDADIKSFRREEQVGLGEAIDYQNIGGLSAELLAKLEAIRPATLGSAARIQGMTPAALAAISAYLRKRAA